VLAPDYVLVLDDGRKLHGDRLLVATGRRPRVAGLGLETAGATFDEHGVRVDAHLRAGERLWAIGDITGVRLLTHVGKYQGEVVAAAEGSAQRDQRSPPAGHGGTAITGSTAGLDQQAGAAERDSLVALRSGPTPR
jgi:pyruvate/2-oxoglutarate dehydrogenase complex dihydrolipoamide dehydrogenase (E3) component